MISEQNWAILADFRKGIEEEYNRNVIGKPERLPAYEETTAVLKDALDRYSVDKTDSEQVYYYTAGVVSTLSFINQYFNVVCHDPHMMSHLSEAAVFLGYLVRELCFEVNAPHVGAE